MRHWSFPLHCPNIQHPHRLFTQPVADAIDDVCVATRFILGPAEAGIVQEARALAAQLQAERRRPPLRQLRVHAPAVEAKACGHLLTMQIQLRLQARTRAQAKRAMARLVATFEAYTNWPNRLRAQRLWRGRWFDRALCQARAWPGATGDREPRWQRRRSGPAVTHMGYPNGTHRDLEATDVRRPNHPPHDHT